MAGRVLVDTNVLVYLFDPREPAKREQSAATVGHLRRTSRAALSQQVLSEFARVSSERVPEGPSRAEIIGAVGDFARDFGVLAITPDVIAEAIAIAGRTGRAFWDAQLIATATLNGIATIVSEDFEDGTVCEGVRFVDPFAEGFAVESLGT